MSLLSPSAVNPSCDSDFTEALGTIVKSQAISSAALPFDKAVDCAVTCLEKDYCFPIDNIARTLATFHALRFCQSNILLKDYGFSVDESAVNASRFHASLCHQAQHAHHAELLNTFLLLNESCKLVSNNLRKDLLIERLNEYEFRACRASTELQEMEKELSLSPAIMRDYATKELDEVRSWFRRLVNKWTQMPLDPVIHLLGWILAKFVSGSSSSAPHAANAITDVLGRLNELGKHPVFGGILSVKRYHVAQVACTVNNVPASWLDVFSKPPVVKTAALMKRFAAQKKAVPALRYGLQRRLFDRSKEFKPLGSFLVADPSGLYWEEFARALSQILFDSGDLSVRITLPDSAGNTSCGRHDNLEKCFEDVRKRPYGVVVFENIEQAKDSAVSILNQILRTGYASDESGSRTDFTKSVILIVLQGLSNCELTLCACRRMIRDSPFKTNLDATTNCFGAKHTRNCVAMLKQAREHVNSETWQLVDDVALFALEASSCVSHHARTVLREMAEDYGHKCLILYPSEAALRTIIWHAREANVYEEVDVKGWLEKHVRPVLENLEENGTINKNSIIFVDNYVGTNELAYMIENRKNLCGDAVAKKFNSWASDMRSVYEKGKCLEECIGSLTVKLKEFSGEVTPLSETSAMHVREAMAELITITGHALSTAVDLKSVKDALGSPVWETGYLDSANKGSKNGEEGDVDWGSKRSKTGEEGDMDRASDSGCPEIITDVRHGLLGRRHCACFLLLGLRDDGKKELVNELVRETASDGVVKILAIDMSEYSDESSLFRLTKCPLRTFSNGNENSGLVEVARKHPKSIFYFDKIEKAHIAVYRILLSLMRYRVMIDDEGNEVDFGRSVLIFGSDCGNKHALALLAGHEGEVDPTIEAGTGQENKKSQACQLRFELLCKVDRWVAFNPFVTHQLKNSRSYQVEDMRSCARSWLLCTLSYIFSPNLEDDPVCSPSVVEALADMSVGSKKESIIQKVLPGLPVSLPDPLPSSYLQYLSNMPLV